jgi:hypothetical protein
VVVEGERAIAVFDIDGVVADVRHRLHHLTSSPKDWTGFFAAAAADPPLETGLLLVADMARNYDIVWLTGRPSRLHAITSTWLDRYGLGSNELHMRANRDYRPARVYKLGELHKLAARSIVAFVDDDDEVVTSAAAAGYPAQLADWVPRANAMRDAQDRLGRS